MFFHAFSEVAAELVLFDRGQGNKKQQILIFFLRGLAELVLMLDLFLFYNYYRANARRCLSGSSGRGGQPTSDHSFR